MDAVRSDRAAAPLWSPGLILGGMGAASMTGVSLFAKDPKLQKIGIGVAGLLFAGVGMGSERLSRALDGKFPGDRLDAQLALSATGSTLAAGLGLATKGRVTGAKAGVSTLGLLAAGGGIAGATGTLIAHADDKLPGPDTIGQLGAAALATGSVLAFMKRGVHLDRGRSVMLPDVPQLALDAKNVGQLAQDWGRGVRGPVTSGRPGSVLAWEQQSGQGQRFLTEMPRASEIDAVMGTTGAKEPARVYASLGHANPELGEKDEALERVGKVMQDAEGLGIFGGGSAGAAPRKHIMIAATTSSGFVNPVAASSFEFMHGGDSAILAVQAGKTKAAGEMHHIGRATFTLNELLKQTNERIAKLPAAERPKVYVYGESFGAWTAQNTLLGTGDGNMSWLARKLGKWDGEVSWVDRKALTPEVARARFRNFGIDHAMFVGTPKFAAVRPALEGVEELTGGAHPLVRTVKNGDEITALTPEDAAKMRVMFLQHDADPVALFTPKLLWERPEWLGPKATRGEGISPHQTWVPITTGLQTAFDQQMAQYFKSGVLEEKGHDYRRLVSYAMRRAFNASHVSDEQVARMREWARQLEIIHEKYQKEAAEAAGAGAA